MPVEEVHFPGRTKVIDPKQVTGDWDLATSEALARRKYLETEQAIRAITNPPEAPQSPFQVKGEVNLGTIDLQEQAREANARVERERKESLERIAVMQTTSEELKEKLHQTELARSTDALTTKLDLIQKQLAEAGSTKPKGFIEQMAEITAMAEALGLGKPVTVPGASDPQLAVMLKKMDFDLEQMREDATDRRTQSDRQWQMDIRRLDNEQQETTARIAIEQQKLQAMFSLPEKAGSIFARAVVDGTRDKTQAAPIAGAPAKSKIIGEVGARPGEVGEVDCPNPQCNASIGIGPTVKVAECAHCHSRVKVVRDGA
ncbi:MAG: hypothetical protein Q8P12_02145, partial [bacterium]|nr:hypothetical protein [bacterium]